MVLCERSKVVGGIKEVRSIRLTGKAFIVPASAAVKSLQAEDAEMDSKAWSSFIKADHLEILPRSNPGSQSLIKAYLRSRPCSNHLEDYDGRLAKLVAEAPERLCSVTIQDFDPTAAGREVWPPNLFAFTNAITTSPSITTNLKSITIHNDITANTAQQLLSKLHACEHISLRVFTLLAHGDATFHTFPKPLKHLSIQHTANCFSSWIYKAAILLDCAGLSQCPQLQSITMNRGVGLQSVARLADCTALQELQLVTIKHEECDALCEALAELPDLRSCCLPHHAVSICNEKWPSLAAAVVQKAA
jgi:hypothetical protein